MVASPELMTAAQLTSIGSADRRAELIRGRLLVSEPPGYEHGAVLARVTFAVALGARDDSALHWAKW
jgi:hypothetical protein